MDVRYPESPPESQLILLDYISAKPLLSEAVLTHMPEDGEKISAVPPASKMTLPVYKEKYETKESLSHKKKNRFVHWGNDQSSQGSLSTKEPSTLARIKDFSVFTADF